MNEGKDVTEQTPGQLAAGIGQFGRHVKYDAGVNCLATPADIRSGSNGRLSLAEGSPAHGELTRALGVVLIPSPTAKS